LHQRSYPSSEKKGLASVIPQQAHESPYPGFSLILFNVNCISYSPYPS
jgi:hypothetical protein